VIGGVRAGVRDGRMDVVVIGVAGVDVGEFGVAAAATLELENPHLRRPLSDWN
jgi:hypothetical protein